MVQETIDKSWQAEARSEETKQFIKDIKHLTHRKFTAAEKNHIVLEGFRHDTTMRDLCYLEGIHLSTYCAQLKDFLEVGKARIIQDTVRDATNSEVQDIKCENARLKQLVAELSLQVNMLKKRPYRVWNKGKICRSER